jgi:hypothetical protein
VSARRNAAFIWFGITFFLIVVLGAGPLILTLIAGGIAGVLGCTLNEGGVYPCPFMGHDLGEPLVVMFVLGWLAFATLPFGLIAFGVWFATLCIYVSVRWRRRRRATA